MNGWWSSLQTWLDHPGVRIPPEDGAGNLTMVVTILAMLEAQARQPAQSAPAPQAASAAVQSGPPKALVTDLCNRLLLLSRSVKKAKEQGGPEADRLRGHLDRLDKALGEHSIAWEDLSGQAYDPGRTDFEALAEPQEMAGLTRKTIIQCERPVVRLGGKVIQTAKGIVGKPPE